MATIRRLGRAAGLWLSLAALLAGVLVVLSDASPAHAVELPNDAEGHRHVTGVLDVSRHRCGTYLRGGDLTGLQTSPSSYDYATPSPMGTTGANAIDRHWVQDRGALASALVFDLAEPVEEVDLFPAIDHGPVPGEALESTVYGFDRLDAPTAEWEVGDISVLFDQGWSDWISDDWVSRWGFQEHDTAQELWCLPCQRAEGGRSTGSYRRDTGPNYEPRRPRS